MSRRYPYWEKPPVPRCGNQRPYCPRAGMEMAVSGESERDWLFTCRGCGQAHIVTKPAFKRFVQDRIQAGRPVKDFERKYF